MPLHAPTRIKELRTQAGLSVSELAARLDLTQPNVSKIENARISVSLDLLYRIADVLGVALMDLIEDTQQRTLLAAIRGRLYSDGPAEAYLPPYKLVTVPMGIERPVPIEAFETEDGFVYGIQHYPRPEDHRRRFVTQRVGAFGARILEERRFERSEVVSGFSTDTGPPLERWIPTGADIIETVWLVIGEYRAE